MCCFSRCFFQRWSWSLFCFRESNHEESLCNSITLGTLSLTLKRCLRKVRFSKAINIGQSSSIWEWIQFWLYKSGQPEENWIGKHGSLLLLGRVSAKRQCQFQFCSRPLEWSRTSRSKIFDLAFVPGNNVRTSQGLHLSGLCPMAIEAILIPWSIGTSTVRGAFPRLEALWSAPNPWDEINQAPR